ncbi:solute carrier family 15 member 4-like [Saccostrea echinata]|uniref:solute carrier family 15 member 4-like n=1 Tax=Saccostrea echinata TaxID=191078 RepID=UPI002A80EDF8|nr:solute carrier family 15 member 4-like [Saccostrea echinata]
MDERRSLLSSRRGENEPRPGNAFKVKVAQGSILLTVALERLAFYSLTGNLVLFLNSLPFSWKSYNALYCTFVFLGISYVLSFVGGIVADTWLGKFKTLLLSFIIYLVGYIFLPVITFEKETSQNTTFLPDICGKNDFDDDKMYEIIASKGKEETDLFSENCAGLIFGVLTIIAFGSGIFRSVIAPFGADQVRGEGPQTSLAFFNWYYWSINLGTLIALSVITYVQQDFSFSYGYLSANICLALSCIVFITGCWSYVCVPKTGSILTNIFKILFESCQRRKINRHRLNNVEQVSADISDIPELPSSESSPSFLDRAKYRYGGSFHETAVDDVKQLLKILCVFLTTLPYWMVYFQMQTTFELQGLHMKLHLSHAETFKICNNSFPNYTPNSNPNRSTVVAAWFTLFDVIFLIILLPLFDRVIYPYWARRGKPVGMVFRISLGMMFATCAVLVAGIVELFRLKAVWKYPNEECCSSTINQTIGHTVYRAADMSVFWQIPQYALIGISEVFASVAALEFAYQMAPKSMKGIIMGFFYLFTGIGSLLGTGTMFAFKGTWFFQEDFGNINCRMPCNSDGKYTRSCHLDYYFFFLAGLEFVGMFVFIVVARLLKLTQHLVAINKPAQLAGVHERSFRDERRDGLVSSGSQRGNR